MMKIGFYFDEHIRRAVAEGLIKRGYTVVMANDVDMTGKDDDSEHLPYALARQLVMVTLDKPFAGRTQLHTDHAGLICWTDQTQPVGRMIALLGEFAEAYTPEEAAGKVFWRK